MHRLPDDLIRVIGYYLEGEDFFTFQATTSRFRKILKHDIWKNLIITPKKSGSSAISRPVLRLRYGRCNKKPWYFTDDHTCLARMAKAKYHEIGPGNEFDPQTNVSLRDGLSCVKFLSVTVPTSPDGNQIILNTLKILRPHLHRLKYIELRGGAKIDADLIHLLAIDFPRIQEIKFDNQPLAIPSALVGVGGPPTVAPRVSALSLCYDTEIYGDRRLVDNLSLLRGLSRLSLYYSSSQVQLDNRAFFDAERLNKLLSNFPRLLRLETSAPIFNPQGIIWLPDTIQSLVISGATGMDDPMADNGRFLHELTVYGPLTETTFQSYNLQSLQTLDIISPYTSPDMSAWETVFDAIGICPLKSLTITVPELGSFWSALGLRYTDNVFTHHLLSLRLNYTISASSSNCGEYLCPLLLPKLEFLLLDIELDNTNNNSRDKASLHVKEILDFVVSSCPRLVHLYLSYEYTLCLDIAEQSLVDYYGHRILDSRDDAHFCTTNPIYRIDISALRNLRNIAIPMIDDSDSI